MCSLHTGFKKTLISYCGVFVFNKHAAILRHSFLWRLEGWIRLSMVSGIGKEFFFLSGHNVEQVWVLCRKIWCLSQVRMWLNETFLCPLNFNSVLWSFQCGSIARVWACNQQSRAPVLSSSQNPEPAWNLLGRPTQRFLHKSIVVCARAGASLQV